MAATEASAVQATAWAVADRVAAKGLAADTAVPEVMVAEEVRGEANSFRKAKAH